LHSGLPTGDFNYVLQSVTMHVHLTQDQKITTFRFGRRTENAVNDSLAEDHRSFCSWIFPTIHI